MLYNVDYVSNQLIIDSDIFPEYFQNTLKNTRTNHIKLIKDYYGYQDFSTPEVQNYLSNWLENRL
ncbi:DUF4158 domain-containing protein [Enterococcus faecalis]|uniref:DUF4158 domain-containing protein n=1 Tax=Enterococcus faecalis TaxID=1351 RepID=UPI003CC69BD7